MRIVSLWSVAVLSTMCAVGCVADEAPQAADGATGSISFPLIQTVGSVTYRLSGHLEVTEADGTVRYVDATANVPEVIVPVSPGVNRVELLPGWTLARSDDGTTFVPVSALLGSANPVDLATPANRTTPWVLDFLVQDSGSALRVVFGVLEHPQQLTSILTIQNANNDYLEYVGEIVDVEIFMRASSLPVIDAQGNHTRSFRASSFATQVYGDHHGKLSTLLDQMAGGSLNMVATNFGEGFGNASGGVLGTGGATTPSFSFSSSASFGLDPDGTPSASGFVELGGLFTLWSGGEYVVSGAISSGVYQDN